MKAISLNNMYSTGRGGKRFLTKAGREFKKEFAWAVFSGLTSNIKFFNEEGLMEGDLVVELIFCFTDKRKRDVDNLIKATLDACTGILWVDDNQVVAVYAEKRIDIEESIDIQVSTPKDCKTCGHYYVEPT